MATYTSETSQLLNKELGARITRFGTHALFFAMTVIYLWFGGMKFTGYEANGIHGFVSNSPLLSWMYNFMSLMGFSYFLGVLEIAIGVLIAARLFSPKFSLVGGALSAGLFLTTLSFMLTTPGVFEPSLGFPAISVVPGQFLLKDLGLLAVSIFIVGSSITALEQE
ncbi:YkgB family protein [Pseudomonas sp. NPDC090202]|uniref:YkgB family protein n=1 Tax=unclassified Pseudomonas TaxID=196821 RepID=UPI0038259D37